MIPKYAASNRPLPVLITLLIGLVWLAGCARPTPPASATPPAVASPEPETASSSTSTSVPSIRFGRIGVSDGLSHSVVTCVMQDRQGFIWVGTQDGLDRYDGYAFKVFRPVSNDSQTISDRWINALFQDGDGYIWIGTRSGGLNRYDPVSGLFTRFMNDPADSSSLSSDRVQAIFEDSQGRLWVGTAHGLERFVPATGGFEHYDLSVVPASEPGNTKPPLSSEKSLDNITAIIEDTHGYLWIGTAYAGLNRYDEENGVFINYSHAAFHPASLSSNSIRSIQEDTNGRLWVGTDRGVNIFNPTTGVSSRFLHSSDDTGSLASNSVQSVYVDDVGNVWVGTSDGLDWYDRATRNFVHYRNDPRLESSLSNNIVTAISESNDGVLWIGTSGGGLNKFYRGQGWFKYFHFGVGAWNNLGGNIIRSISVDQRGDVWIGTLDGGLDRLDPRTDSVMHVLSDMPDPGSSEIWSVYADNSGALWVGASDGLYVRAQGSSNFVNYRHNPDDEASLIGSPVYAIAEDSAQNLWIGTEFGLDWFDRTSKVFTHYQSYAENPYSLSANEIRVLYADRSGSLWIGTAHDGLNRYDPVTGQFYQYQAALDDPDSISSDSILSIYQDSAGTLWVGTDGGGLNRLDPATDSFTHYGEEDGLPNSVINGILEDENGYLWLSTNYGLSNFDPESGRSLRNYTVGDGLQGNEFSPNAAAKDRDGRLYFGGVDGLTVFDPEQIGRSSFVPPVVLLSITQDGVPLNVGTTPETVQEITLHWPQSGFKFEYSALSYAQPGKNQYAYMLENFDQHWNEVGAQRSGWYTNLPGGKYVLRIKASNQDGVWNETGISIPITVVPPLWQTLWFQLSLGGGIVAFGLTAYWWRVKSIQSHNRELERQVRDRTQEIEKLFERTKELAVVEERNRLARELHDSAKQKAFAALAQLGTANGLLKKKPKEAKSHLVEAENLVYQVIEELTFLIQEMYPAALKEKGLAATLREYLFEWEDRSDIKADVRIENERRLHLDLEQAIYRVVQEALSNVSRHSHATHVEVVLSYTEDSVAVIVADNGCGFDPKVKPSGVGLRSIRERIESLGGAVEIDSLPGCGTRLTVHLPVSPKEEQPDHRSEL